MKAKHTNSPNHVSSVQHLVMFCQQFAPNLNAWSQAVVTAIVVCSQRHSGWALTFIASRHSKDRFFGTHKKRDKDRFLLCSVSKSFLLCQVKKKERSARLLCSIRCDQPHCTTSTWKEEEKKKVHPNDRLQHWLAKQDNGHVITQNSNL